METFILVLATAILGATGDILINKWAQTSLVRWWAFSLPAWIATATVFGILLKQNYYAFSVALIVILLIHSGLVIGWDTIIEGTTITTVQWIGIALAIIAIILLQVGRVTK